MKFRFLNNYIYFLFIILKQTIGILSITNNKNVINIDNKILKEDTNNDLIKIDSKNILNINFANKLKEAENNLYKNLLNERGINNNNNNSVEEIIKINQNQKLSEQKTELETKSLEKNKSNYNKVIDNFEKKFFSEQTNEKLQKNENKDSINSFKRVNGEQINKLNKTEKITLKESLQTIIPSYNIENLETNLKIRNDKTYGQITETVKFVLKNGIFTSIIRKVSLAGSSDSVIAFKASSNDLKLKEARIINNCFEESMSQKQIKSNEKKNNVNSGNNNYSFHPYICVIAIFEEVNAKDAPFEAIIQYEYIAQNILRFRENPNMMNSIVWYYDNYKRLQSIQNIKFIFEIQDFNYNSTNYKNKNENFTDNMVGYPDKFSTEFQADKNSTIIIWNIKSVPENDYQKISIDMPLFNSKCRKLYDVQIELYSYSVLHFFLWFVIIIIFIFMIAYIYINEKEKHFSMKLSEEIRDIKVLSQEEKRYWDEEKKKDQSKNDISIYDR